MATSDSGKAKSGSPGVSEDFSLIRPSLLKELRSILEQYPDDGQILKELIQNAEDAGATEVKFMYDQHKYPTSKLHHPGLATYQGEALYSYNNAEFEEKDWTGIRLLQDSIKESDPSKVGRFGLGFKSVLHMTDLPSVSSRERVAFIDPHEKFFSTDDDRRTGIVWNVCQQLRNLEPIKDQFTPFTNIYDCNISKGVSYKGTLFRFPLRTVKSKLSETLYTEDRIQDLFRNFESDAHLVLLFLKNVESVEFSVRGPKESNPSLKFKVQVSPDCLEDVRVKRREFMQSQKGEFPMECACTYPITIETLKFEDGKSTKVSYQYIVNEYFAGDNISTKFKKLSEDKTLNNIPMVGTAMAVNRNTNSEAGDQPLGQVFCFLPLPLEEKSPTGLPVHVNGYFSVTQNRRHLKWPTLEQNISSDKSLLWNQCLLRELLPLSYFYLILAAIDLNQDNPAAVSARDIYHSFPDDSRVDEKWVPLLDMLEKLFRNKVFYTSLHGGKWVGLDECYFDCLREREHIEQVVRDVLLSCDICVVDIPDHMLVALGKYTRHNLNMINPQLVRRCLKQKPAIISGISKDLRYCLLEYIMKDGEYDELIDIQHILPLANGAFATVMSASHSRLQVFLPTQLYPKTLLPGQDELFLIDGLPETLMSKLKMLAEERITQLAYLTHDLVLQHLPSSIPQQWKGETVYNWNPSTTPHIPENWLTEIWTFLKNGPYDSISKVEGLPILSLTNSAPFQLVPLETPSRSILLENPFGGTLSKGVQTALEKMGVNVVKSIMPCMREHVAVVGNYVRIPFPQDIFDCLVVLFDKTKFKDLMNFLKENQNKGLHEDILIEMSKIEANTLNRKLTALLKALPVFPSTNTTSDATDWVSVTEITGARAVLSETFDRVHNFLVDKYIVLENDSAKSVGKLLGVNTCDMATVLQASVLPRLDPSIAEQEETQDLIHYIFENSQILESNVVLVEQLKHISFVQIGDDAFSKPCLLFDPKDEILCDLFQDEGKFPVQKYSSNEFLVVLRKLGLKSRADLVAGDILERIRNVDKLWKNVTPDSKELLKIANAVVYIINTRSSLLLDNVNGHPLKAYVSDLCWVPVKSDPPSDYPECVEWSSEDLASPKFVRSAKWSYIIGSVVPVISVEMNDAAMRELGLNSTPTLCQLIDHFTKVIASYKTSEKSKFLLLVEKWYQYVCGNVSVPDLLEALKSNGVTEWIWYGDGFTSPENVIIRSSHIDLKPYIRTLPTEMNSFIQFFDKCGAHQSCTDDLYVQILHRVCKYHENNPDVDKQDIERDLQLAIDVLNVLKTKLDQNRGQLDTDLQVLVPVNVKDGSKLRMVAVDECTYCDVEWLRKGMNLMEFDETDGILFKHPLLPDATAISLNMPSLMSRMLQADELQISGFGQCESLTSRLRSLLNDYTDGLSIPKELLQNADDAGATEIKFLIDMRANENAKKFLIDEHMKHCQGPAIWVHNDAMFTERDLVNITKLGGETKAPYTEKIGKFGLGFNAVYNITDVPSFVSGSNMVFFDPHTTFLGQGIRDKSKPGIRINLLKSKLLIEKLSDQFYPYQNIFGCHIDPNDLVPYKGTLFRLPLRTHSQAMSSEISNIHYNKDQVLQLMKMIMDNSHKLLLFTQSVKKLSVHYIPPDGGPESVICTFDVSKSVHEIVRGPPMIDHNTKGTVFETLKCATFYAKQSKKPSRRNVTVLDVPASSFVLKTTMEVKSSGVDVLSSEASINEKAWFISHSYGQNESLEFSRKNFDGSYIPVGGCAVEIENTAEGYVILDDKTTKGQLFCFLPLPWASGLPVHVNGCFAVQANRRGLAEKTEDDKYNPRHEWNQRLLKDAVARAYIQLLADLKCVLSKEEHFEFLNLWPRTDVTMEYYLPVALSFYQKLTSALQHPVVQHDSIMYALKDVIFIDQSFALSQTIKDAAMELIQQLCPGCKAVIMPSSLLQSFEKSECETFLQEKYVPMRMFYEKYFFRNICKIEGNSRDELLLFAITNHFDTVKDLVRDTECIPVAPDGSSLKAPSRLIGLDGILCKLFLPEEGRFPHEKFAEPQIVEKLKTLGLKVNEYSWDDITESTIYVQRLMQETPAKGHDRFVIIIDAMHKYLGILKKLKQDANTKDKIEFEIQQASGTLINIPFVPLMTKPKDVVVKWKNDEFSDQDLLPPSAVFHEHNMMSVYSEMPIMRKVNMSNDVKKFLHLYEKSASSFTIIRHLLNVAEVDLASLNEEQYREIWITVTAVYNELNKLMNDKGEAELIRKELCNERCIFNGGIFLHPRDVAFFNPHDCRPYLYQISNENLSTFKDFLKHIGVRNMFEVGDFANAIDQVHKEYGVQALPNYTLRTVVNLTSGLQESMAKEGMSFSEVTARYGKLYVPNKDSVLCPSDELFFNETNWEISTNNKSAHPKLSLELCKAINIKTSKILALDECSYGIPFGQSEKLTTSLKRILQHYPLGHDILKELIQNADDAKASEIHFVLDDQQYPKEEIFDKTWGALQGPALCVYNDSPFTKEDIEGIKSLGEGSKRYDPSKTGQYGIGFSSIYHLTDVPCILTNIEGEGENMFVFDPNCKYVPGATISKPGKRFFNVDYLKQKFPDVFACFPINHFNMDRGTLFRFPLRTESMAKDSDISKKPVKVEELNRVLMCLNEELSDILVFTKHLQKVSVSVVDTDTKELVRRYYVKRTVAPEKEDEIQKFFETVKQEAKLFKKKEKSLNEIITASVAYELAVEHNHRTDHLFVVQQLGIDQNIQVPQDITNAVQNQGFTHLPFGGVAGIIPTPHIWKFKTGRVSCLLPMPIDSDLPVSINGNFALGNERRGRLWTRKDGEDYKAEWNEFLLKHVVIECYVRFLEGMTKYCSLDVGNVFGTKSNLTEILIKYQSLFPVVGQPDPDSDESEWLNFKMELYRRIASSACPLFPCVKQVVEDPEHPRFKLEWYPVEGEGQEKAFFSVISEVVEEPQKKDSQKSSSLLTKAWSFMKSLKPKTEDEETEADKQDRLRDTLVSCGFKLVEVTRVIVDSFQCSGITLDLMSPKSVVKFFSSYSSDHPVCSLGQLPLPLKDTPIQNTQLLTEILRYCKQDTHFHLSMDGLPLLLTADGQLQVFSAANPVFKTTFWDLLGAIKHLFVHQSIRDLFLEEKFMTDPSVFKNFGTKDFAEHLHTALDPNKYHLQIYPVEWKYAADEPDVTFVLRFWHFVEYLEKLAGNKDASEDNATKEKKMERIGNLLEPLNEWALVPAFRKGNKYLVPIEYSYLVYGTSFSKDVEVNTVLRKLPLYNMKLEFFTDDQVFKDYISTSVNKPLHVLKMLHSLTKGDDFASKLLSADDCATLLVYFEKHRDVLTPCGDSIDMLRDLPIYETVSGELIALSDKPVYALPAGIPTDEVEPWQGRMGLIFLQKQAHASDLYEYIGCKSLSQEDVYNTFLLPGFDLFTPDVRHKHLHYLYSQYVKNPDADEDKKESVMESLSELRFIESEDGELKQAKEFYDPENIVFNVMLQKEDFPPRVDSDVFKQSEWYDLLRKLGMQSRLSQDMYKQYTQDVANEGKYRENPSAQLKSKTLVDYLFKMPMDEMEDILPAIAEVPFIAPARAKGVLTKIFPQYGDSGDGHLSYICFKGSVSYVHEVLVWTRVNLLPSWADPKKITTSDLAKVMSLLEVKENPDMDMVIANFRTVCEAFSSSQVIGLSAQLKINLFKTVYNYLQEHSEDNPDVLRGLKNEDCLLVDSGKHQVAPQQMVFNLYDSRELEPYLYKVPLDMEMGKYAELFKRLGVLEKASCEQYAMILLKMKRRIGKRGNMLPYELITACRAVRGLFETLPTQGKTDTEILFLPSEKGCLERSDRLVFNNAPSFYNRIESLGVLHFMMDLHQAGLQLGNDEEAVISQLPTTLRPMFLSQILEEVLTDESLQNCHHSTKLGARLKSDQFRRGIIRLLRHSCHEKGVELTEDNLNSLVDQLSLIEVYESSILVTKLIYQGSDVKESEARKSCHVHKRGARNNLEIYIKKGENQTADLLIPLCEAINVILDGKLGDAVLYLLPILECNPSEVDDKLDQLNIRVDRMQKSRRKRVMPLLGAEVPEEDRVHLEWEHSDFIIGEYVGVKEDATNEPVYGVVTEIIAMGDDEKPMFRVDLGSDKGCLTFQHLLLYKFVRNDKKRRLSVEK